MSGSSNTGDIRQSFSESSSSGSSSSDLYSGHTSSSGASASSKSDASTAASKASVTDGSSSDTALVTQKRFGNDSTCSYPPSFMLFATESMANFDCATSEPSCVTVTASSMNYQTNSCSTFVSVESVRDEIWSQWADYGSDYFVLEKYTSENCALFEFAAAFLDLNRTCQTDLSDQAYISSEEGDGSITVHVFDNTSACHTAAFDAAMIISITVDDLDGLSCVSVGGHGYIGYTRTTFTAGSTSLGSFSSSRSSSPDPTATVPVTSGFVATLTPTATTPAPASTLAPAPVELSGTDSIIGVVVGCTILLLVVVTLIGRYCCCSCRLTFMTSSSEDRELYNYRGTLDSAWTPHSKRKGNDALWEDEVVIAMRVPREKVVLHSLISRGGYGEVYLAMYNEQCVAAKTLLPKVRRSLLHVNAFLAEVRMMAVLEHDCIVAFIGVSWDSLNDLCALSEFMAGGDLRGLLDQYEAIDHPVGIDDDKLEMALQIAHALTYLHSLQQPIIHRDLKSRNVLLSEHLDAKLADFGVSREREDTMTAGVGTSLWMAPEVMLGGKYDTKADIFSFGVLMAELDQHSLPYAQQRASGKSKIPDAVVLQMVVTGALRVEFSAQTSPSIAEIGTMCVSTDPDLRPTAAELLYRLQSAAL